MVATGDTAPALPARSAHGMNWPAILWIGFLHLGALAVPFYFHWSGLVVFAALYVVSGLGITLGYHRLLTHKSFTTHPVVEFLLTVCGMLANEGGPLRWVSTHRSHHTHSDDDGDPHSPTHGFWWSHLGWWTRKDPPGQTEEESFFNVKDLAKRRMYRILQRIEIVPPLLSALTLFIAGECVGGLGTCWLIYGFFARTVFTYHCTWLVNSAAHVWGYRNFNTDDKSRNLWWVAMLTFGEGWHNNHHAHQRSARHGLRWWEIDLTYMVIRMMALVGLAKNIHVAPTPKAQEGSKRSVWRVLFPRAKNLLARR